MEERLKSLLRESKDRAIGRGVKVSFVYHHEESHTVRIANNGVSLNASESLSRLFVEVVQARKTGTCSLLGDRHMSERSIEQAVALAAQKASHAPEKDYVPALDTVEETIDDSAQYDEHLATVDPSVKVSLYGEVVESFGGTAIVSGAWSSGVTEIFIVSTANAHEALHRGTDQHISVMLRHPKERWELYGRQTGWRLQDRSTSRIIADLKQKVHVYTTAKPARVAPGRYPVIFGGEAIAELLQWIIQTGVWGKDREEGRGWLSLNAAGDSVLGEQVTIVDDPDNDRTFRFGFDFSGKKRTRLPVIERGVLRNFLYDRDTAAHYGKRPTGHTLDSLSMVMSCGSDSHDPFAAAARYGKPVLYIPALHYMNSVNSQKGIITGSSRFNALLVESDGTCKPVFATRITETLQHLFTDIVALSDTAVSVNLSHTYGPRQPVAFSTPSYMLCEGVMVTDCAEAF